jgi:ADP-ribose pyrophosphatase
MNSESKPPVEPTSQPLSILTCDCLTPEHPHEPTKKLWLKLYEAHARRGDHDMTWHFASRKSTPEIFGGTGVDAVVIVPLLVTPDGKWRLVVIKEYRIPIAGYEIGFPAGLVEDNSVEDAARRELKEETGLEVTSIDLVSPPLYSSPGLTDESVVMVVCRCAGTPTAKNQEKTEEIQTELLLPNEIKELMEGRGRFSDCKMSAKMWPILPFLMCADFMNK